MIQIVDLHKSFGGNKVLQGVNLTIKKGETLVIIGQSGSGKSILIKHLIGLIRPDLGEIFVDGVEITCLNKDELNQIRRKFAMLFQGAALFDSLTVLQNVSFGLERYTDFAAERIEGLAREALKHVGLRGVENLMPHELSGGMRKRVGLARAIAYQPEIILYDEPSTGIDPIRADAINDLIIQMQKELKVTSIVITHDMVSTYKVADRVAMLYQGKIIETGTPEEIKNSGNPVIQQFITGAATGPIEEW
ncbi:MAG: ABC transporter ATP-binding protein [Candidatus Aminicenantes bacterium]|nr:ABC transporter ATP-binding protein [Candidatus Aminicenantes bacterium]MDH5385751.1 ABC transporter ATP-binding protein [Candidatus Aminicenantes bacterium]MDH5742050.1 ABC transporter ATP-binding protein [Candidatus Aminicenantes bacterium]